MRQGFKTLLLQTYIDAEIVCGPRLNLVLGPNGKAMTNHTMLVTSYRLARGQDFGAVLLVVCSSMYLQSDRHTCWRKHIQL